MPAWEILPPFPLLLLPLWFGTLITVSFTQILPWAPIGKGASRLLAIVVVHCLTDGYHNLCRVRVVLQHLLQRCRAAASKGDCSYHWEPRSLLPSSSQPFTVVQQHCVIDFIKTLTFPTLSFCSLSLDLGWPLCLCVCLCEGRLPDVLAGVYVMLIYTPRI